MAESKRKVHLTTRTVGAAKPRVDRYELWDDRLAGFHVRVTPTGERTFYVRFQAPKGQERRRHKLGKFGEITVDKARRLAQDALDDVRHGHDPAVARREDRDAPTLSVIADRFMREHAGEREDGEPSEAAHCRASTIATYRELLDVHILPRLGRRKVASIELVDVERMHKGIAEGVKPSSEHTRARGGKGVANRALHLISTVFNFAEKVGEREPRSNPCRHVRRFEERRAEDSRFLTAPERARLERVLARADATEPGFAGYLAPSVVACVRLLSLTGARLSEITGLTWRMVDWQHRQLRLPESKTGAKVIPLSASAYELLERLREQSRAGIELVCPSENGLELQNMQRAWATIRKAAKLDGVRLHDLRHSAASDALMAGVPLAMVGALLGHRNPRTTARYAHIDPGVLRAAAQRMGEAIEQRTRDGARVSELDERREAAELRVVGAAASTAPAPKRRKTSRATKARSSRA